MCEVYKGQHLLIDCRDVPRELCLDDKVLLEAMAAAAEAAGSTVISQIRYKFGNDSPPGCTVIVMLDESHCSAHTYADQGLIAMDIFTCGQTDPRDIWEILKVKFGFRDFSLNMAHRFFSANDVDPLQMSHLGS